ncbi:MAG: hypothetical protein WCH39_19060 [Schlesneria sp.]
MAQQKMKVTLKLDITDPVGPSFTPNPQSIVVDGYMPIRAEIKNDKQWHTVRLDAGSKDYIKLFMIDSDIFTPDQSCSGGGHALYTQFIKSEADPIDAIKMDGPHLFLGPSLDLLPSELNSLRFKNTLNKPVNITIVLAKQAIMAEKDVSEDRAGAAPAAAAAQ